jgi:hypothetical protein
VLREAEHPNANPQTGDRDRDGADENVQCRHQELDVTVDAAFADATSVLEAYRLATALIGADPERATAALRKSAPHLLIENK